MNNLALALQIFVQSLESFNLFAEWELGVVTVSKESGSTTDTSATTVPFPQLTFDVHGMLQKTSLISVIQILAKYCGKCQEIPCSDFRNDSGSGVDKRPDDKVNFPALDICIITGKGRNSPGYQPVLKPKILFFLQQVLTVPLAVRECETNPGRLIISGGDVHDWCNLLTALPSSTHYDSSLQCRSPSLFSHDNST
eukprot:CAMPEP_0194593606 /NCGR_PEP_ID=MMETSP0292-20121207/23626_1 /TAXON_ID=39354 /ORGANISM="Heterosigma akashiwo, Strain CCMP2393" /LENGTH=195 /DNA_ID=CAMNT_0039452633 /DNA_START=86 /DNA_END=669 /DNA_ORIENTATION=-